MGKNKHCSTRLFGLLIFFVDLTALMTAQELQSEQPTSKILETVENLGVTSTEKLAPDISATELKRSISDSDLTNKIPCLDKSAVYRARPEKLVNVSTDLSIISISGLDLEKMELRIELYLTQTWEDERCRFRLLPRQEKEITLQGHGLEDLHNLLNHLWMPDTYIINARETLGHEIPQPQQTTKVHFSGLVTHITRLTVTASCPMNLHLFPMDRQQCSLIFQSFSFKKSQVQYSWRDPTKLSFEHSIEYQEKMMPELRILGYKLSVLEALSCGLEVSQLSATFYMERPIGHFIFDLYLPAICIVFMSWINFWLTRSAGPERVGLGMTIVLTLTTLMANANANLPKTSYPKAIGVYLSVCFIFTFAGLVENLFAAMEKKKENPFSQKGKSKKISTISGITNTMPRTEVEEASMELIDKLEPVEKKENTKEFFLWPASIDKKSRIIFPFTFFLVNILYWSYCLSALESLPQDMVMLARADHK